MQDRIMQRRHPFFALLWVGLLSLGLVSTPTLADDPPPTCDWTEGFTVSGIDGHVYAIASRETPEGTQIYVGGNFPTVDGQFANHVALWQNDQWSVLEGPGGVGVDGPVWALEFFDDGSGPALYAGGDFTSAGGVEAHHVARWDGSAWSKVGPADAPGLTPRTFPNAVPVSDFQIFDDGSGPSLYVTGAFLEAGGSPAEGLARWDGAAWSSPLNPFVNGDGPMSVWDDGSGASLYVDGRRLENGDLVLLDLVSWPNYFIASASEVWDDGSGETLYLGGRDEGNRASVLKWTGSEWIVVGRGGAGQIWDLEVFGTSLYASGFFDSLDEADEGLVAAFDGTEWQQVDGLNGLVVRTLEPARVGSEKLIVGGSLTEAGGHKSPQLAFWDGTEWQAPASQVADAGGILGTVNALIEWDDGNGAATYAGGDFLFAGGERVHHIAKWQDGRWMPLVSGGETGLPAEVLTFAVWNDGSGEALYVGGRFETAGGQVVNGVARWDGSTWSPLVGSQGIGVLSHTVYALQPWNLDGRPVLYVGGFFGLAGGLEADHVAAWTGSDWTTVGRPYGPFAGVVYSMEVWDDGAGDALYVGGYYFGTANDQQYLDNIAKWDGATWSHVDPEQDLIFSFVYDLQASRVEGPSYLYSGSSAGVQRFDGQTWTIAGTEDDRITSSTQALAVWDDGSGEALYAGRYDQPAIQRWDGVSWTELEGSSGRGTNASVRTLHAGSQSLGGSALGGLVLGGGFSVAGGVPSAAIAQWTCGPLPFCPSNHAEILCLGDQDRFAVEVNWRDFKGNEDSGQVVPFQTDNSGLFYFFGRNNWELLIKILDACSYNGHYWVFSAATTNVEYELTVTDTVAGEEKRYFNPLGTAAPAITDTLAFATCDVEAESSSAAVPPKSPAEAGISRSRIARPADQKVQDKMACVASDTVMCLDDGRFALEIDWRNFKDEEGPGRVVQGTPADSSGLFQFFGPNNWEVLVKVLDACTLNDRFWLFAAATTNVEYTLRVTDTESGETLTYFNPLGNAADAITDTDAFATCP